MPLNAPSGVSTLAVAVGEEAETLEEVHEPFLIQEGYLQRTPQGRVLPAGNVLNLSPQTGPTQIQRKMANQSSLAILIILWLQLVIGLITLPYSLGHSDGSVMLALSDWAQRIVTFRPDASALVTLSERDFGFDSEPMQH